MTCASCVALIEGRMRKQPGVQSILVALLAGQAEVGYDPAVTTPAKLAQAVRDIGFGASVQEAAASTEGSVQLNIDGMTCASCVHAIESRVQQLPGLYSAKVALATASGEFAFDPAQLSARNIVQ